MADTKYEKYFLRGPKPGETNPIFQKHIAQIDDTFIKCGLSFTLTYVSPKDTHKIHGPHTHDYPELLGYFGTNLDDPFDLGGEIELYMGEEMEKHTFNKSTLIYLPANFVHCPLIFKKVERAFLFMISVPVGKTRETHRKDLVPEKELDKMVFPDHKWNEQQA